jgi:hypothetical protein
MGASADAVYKPPISNINGVGRFDIKVEKPSYYPGEMVKGKIYLTLEPNFSLTGFLTIGFVGEENVEFRYDYGDDSYREK